MKKQTLKKPFNKAKALWTAASVSLVSGVMTPMVMASNANTSTVDPGDVVMDLIDMVCDIFFYIGLLLLAWSIGMLVLAFKNEDADSKSRSMMLLVVSCVLIGLRSFMEIVPGFKA